MLTSVMTMSDRDLVSFTSFVFHEGSFVVRLRCIFVVTLRYAKSFLLSTLYSFGTIEHKTYFVMLSNLIPPYYGIELQLIKVDLL